MKKIFSIVVLAVICLSCNISNVESWSNGKVRYTFTKDSLYIDEIGNEGFGYTYKFANGKCYYTDGLGETDSMMVEMKDNNILVIQNEFGTYEFIRDNK